MPKQLGTDLLVKKFKTVSNSQDSIPMLSLWIIHHKTHHRKIVEAWLDTVKKSKNPHRLTLLYLCNDVVQNCNRKNASIYRESFADVLIEAVSHLRESAIKIDVQRVVRIWAKRGIFDAEFTDQLLAALITNRAPEKLRNKLLIEYKTSTLIDEIKAFKSACQGIEFEQKRLKAIRMDVSSSDAVRKLKDKIGGEKFSNEFEESAAQLESFLEHYETYVEQRKNLLEVLDQGTVYYHAQYHEAKIVVNAYKNFEGRVIRMKQGLDKVKQRFPLRSDGSLPLSVAAQDDDMEMSDEDKELGSKPSKIVAMERKHRRSVTKTPSTSSATQNAAESVLKLLASGLSSMKNEATSDSLKRIITGLANRPGVRLASDTPTWTETTKGTSVTFQTGSEHATQDRRSAAPPEDCPPGIESPPSPTGSSDLNIASPSRHQSLDSRLAEFFDSRITRDKRKVSRHDSDNDSDSNFTKFTKKSVNKANNSASGLLAPRKASDSEPSNPRSLDFFNSPKPSVVSSITAKESSQIKNEGGFKPTMSVQKSNQSMPTSDGSSTPTLDEVSYAAPSSHSTILSPPRFSGDAFNFLTQFVGSANKLNSDGPQPSVGSSVAPMNIQSSNNQEFDRWHPGKDNMTDNNPAPPQKQKWEEHSSNIVVPVWPLDASPSDAANPTSPLRSRITETDPWHSYPHSSDVSSLPSSYASSTWPSGSQQDPINSRYSDSEMRSTTSKSDIPRLVSKQRSWELDESCDIDYRANSSGLTPDQGLSVSSSSTLDDQPDKLPVGFVPGIENKSSMYEKDLRSNNEVFVANNGTPPLLSDGRNWGERDEEQRKFIPDNSFPPRMPSPAMRTEFPHGSGPLPIRRSPEKDISQPFSLHLMPPEIPNDADPNRPPSLDDISQPFPPHPVRSEFLHDVGPNRPAPPEDPSRLFPPHSMRPEFAHDIGPNRPPPEGPSRTFSPCPMRPEFPPEDPSRPFSPHSMRPEFHHDQGPNRSPPEDPSRPFPPRSMRPEFSHDEGPNQPPPPEDPFRPFPPRPMRPEFPHDQGLNRPPSDDISQPFAPRPMRPEFHHDQGSNRPPSDDISRPFPPRPIRPEFPFDQGSKRPPLDDISRPFPPRPMRPEFPHDQGSKRPPLDDISRPFPPRPMRPEFPHDQGSKRPPSDDISRPFPPRPMRPEFSHDQGPIRHEHSVRPSLENNISRPIRPEFPREAGPNCHEPPIRPFFRFPRNIDDRDARFHSPNHPNLPNDLQRFKGDNDRRRFPVRPTSPSYPPRFDRPPSPRERFPQRPMFPHNIRRSVSPPHPRRSIAPRMRLLHPARPLSPRERFAPSNMHRLSPRMASPMLQASTKDDLIELELARLTDERRMEEEALKEAGLMHVPSFPHPRPSIHRFPPPPRSPNFRPRMMRPPPFNGMPRIRF